MELNREQVIKALECCRGKGCKGCPLQPKESLSICITQISQNALSLIKELTRKLECANLEIECKEHICESYMLQYGTVADKEVWLKKERADTVRKMKAEIEARCIKGGIYPAFVKSTIDQIAEEIIGERK